MQHKNDDFSKKMLHYLQSFYNHIAIYDVSFQKYFFDKNKQITTEDNFWQLTNQLERNPEHIKTNHTEVKNNFRKLLSSEFICWLRNSADFLKIKEKLIKSGAELLIDTTSISSIYDYRKLIRLETICYQAFAIFYYPNLKINAHGEVNIKESTYYDSLTIKTDDIKFVQKTAQSNI